MLITKTKATINIRSTQSLGSHFQISHDGEDAYLQELSPRSRSGSSLQTDSQTCSEEHQYSGEGVDDPPVPSPDRNRASVQLQGESDAITDEYIAMDIFLYFQEHVENLLGAFYSSFTNDHVRKMVMDMVARTIAETNALVHYLRAKGWMEKPPW